MIFMRSNAASDTRYLSLSHSDLFKMNFDAKLSPTNNLIKWIYAAQQRLYRFLIISVLMLQAFCIYMLVTSFTYFLFLYIDIRMHVHRAKQALKEREAQHELIKEYIHRMNVSK